MKTEITKVKVEDLRVGDLVDLESCPYFESMKEEHPIITFEYAEVERVEQETPDCVAVSYSGIDTVGYHVGVELLVLRGGDENN